MIGRTNAAARAGFVKGGDVLVSHSAGASGMIDHGVVTMAAGSFRLLEVKQSGTLSFDADQLAQGILADICIVSGGDGGDKGGPGGSGGFLLNYFNVLINANLLAVVGAGGAAGVNANNSTGALGGVGGRTSFQFIGHDALYITPNMTHHMVYSYTPYSNYFKHGTGCGALGGAADNTSNSRTQGNGLAKYPFEDSSYFDPHCGAGGGGKYTKSDYTGGGGSFYSSGGNGGTNGGNGGASTAVASYAEAVPGVAGDSSAGSGGSPGGNATNYGGGGGGGNLSWSHYSDLDNYNYSNGGAGYQGVIWIRIPVAA